MVDQHTQAGTARTATQSAKLGLTPLTASGNHVFPIVTPSLYHDMDGAL
jgi:hypothetical protein